MKRSNPITFFVPFSFLLRPKSRNDRGPAIFDVRQTYRETEDCWRGSPGSSHFHRPQYKTMMEIEANPREIVFFCGVFGVELNTDESFSRLR